MEVWEWTGLALAVGSGGKGLLGSRLGSKRAFATCRENVHEPEWKVFKAQAGKELGLKADPGTSTQSVGAGGEGALAGCVCTGRRLRAGTRPPQTLPLAGRRAQVPSGFLREKL